MIIAVDFDGTLALGNAQYISMLTPNRELIQRLKALKAEIGPKIIIVTARGGKDGLSGKEKRRKYTKSIEGWLETYGVPYDEISFQKEYANLYIDDQTITPHSGFAGFKSTFTNNRVILTETTAIKFSKSAPFEHEWYKAARWVGLPVPRVEFCNDECIITERVPDESKPDAKVFIHLLWRMNERMPPKWVGFETYVENIKDVPDMSENTRKAVAHLPELNHVGTFFHGDLSTTNVLCSEGSIYLIDPNCKGVFGSYLTDAGKAVFSLIAYEQNFQEAQKIVDEFGKDVWHFAVAEGLRVCKYVPEYISFVNNIADLI